MTQEEITKRSKSIDLLRNNVNLLKSEFNSQMERSQKQTANPKKVQGKGKKNNKEFVDIFAVNDSNGSINPGEVDDERALTG